MERVAFLIERTGERVFAMINPDELTFERQSGVAMRSRRRQPLATARRSDDPLIVTGGGVTDLKLNLLFDVDLLSRRNAGFSQAPDYRQNIHAPPSRGRTPLSSSTEDSAASVQEQPMEPEPVISDVRTLSRPLWSLTENDDGDPTASGPPVVNFIWGSAWNIPCIAISVAERFDFFSREGEPLRSWMRIHLRRTARPDLAQVSSEPSSAATDLALARDPFSDGAASASDSLVVVDPVSSSRPDLLCNGIYGDTRLIHPLLEYNDIDDFWAIEPGRVLMTPPASVLREQTP